MNRINKKYLIYLSAIAVIFIYSCTTTGEEKYHKLVKQELAKGTKVDSLFLGISFGMTSKTFFGYCWELNKKGIISDGSNNTMVLYKVDSGLKYPASMNFYPDFIDNKISNMRVTFQYNAWAPWNKAQFADSLLPDLLHLYKKWYPAGNDFIALTNKERKTIYVKVDGNRRITLGKYDDMIVKVDFTDLLIEEKIKNQHGIK
ncbi:hypothetical protein [Ferruginibacter sp.]|uniref:hypothetical protein n=1 Tax=Ferruginibacter sp. TaxID=1940288 RepID=UPI0019A45846|nr:hypothetical protein [Ferruginibacter sp.]MBC7628769.1 hypothetical protein [Ferruginibacter sp.]